MRSTDRILIDVGSSSVKVYECVSNCVEQVSSHTIRFKDDFDVQKGLSVDKKEALVSLINKKKEEYGGMPVSLYATALYRKLSPKARRAFVDEFYERTGLFFNIIDHELENFYLQVALVGKYKGNEDVLLINIGGGSTELAVLSGQKTIENVNIDIGVGTILKKFPRINEKVSKVDLSKIVDYITSKLPELRNKVKIGFYSGGELTYMRLAGYNLQNNHFFKDPTHPSIIKYKDFASRNKEIFDNVTLKELEEMMPENPKWMHGARACSGLAQAVCKKYGIETIVPSDANLIDGVVRQEFRNVTISGSFRKHFDDIVKIKEFLTKRNVNVLSPRFTKPKDGNSEFVIFEGEEGETPLKLERYHLDSITNSDALVVCNPGGYVGASTMIEIGYANNLGKRIVFIEEPDEFMLRMLPAQINLF